MFLTFDYSAEVIKYVTFRKHNCDFECVSCRLTTPRSLFRPYPNPPCGSPPMGMRRKDSFPPYGTRPENLLSWFDSLIDGTDI